MRLLLTLPLALALCAGAMAKDKEFDRDATVETLKAKTASSDGFEVEEVRAGDGGFACVTYQVRNDQQGRKQMRALVKGDQVLRESNRYISFDKAWNSKCSGA